MSSPLAHHAASPSELRARIEAERQGQPFLVYRDEGGGQVLFILGTDVHRVNIGRSAGNELALTWDTEVSRLHAEMVRAGGEWTISDDGLSRNGTYVGGQRVSGRHRLRDGDVVSIGRTELAYVVPGGGDSRPTEIAGSRPAVPEPTPMQRKVLVALCRPFRDSEVATPATNQQIADELFLSVDAVKGHLRALFSLFGLEDLPQNQKRTYLAARALQSGVVTTREL